MSQTHFLLSPARCDGRRAAILLNPSAEFPIARRLREPDGLAIGEAFAFMSGLYFRGKLAYALAFARAREGSGVHVIAPGAGLLDPAHPLRREELLRMAEIGVALDERRYREPLARAAHRLEGALGPGDRVVLLGSIATDKYVGALGDRLAARLTFPREFVGRGDMSRGGLMLRCAREGRELEYVAVAGAIRHGPRPPKLEPVRAAGSGSRAERAPESV